MAPINEVWAVVGGAPKGGLLVRKSKEKLSEEVQGRLSVGALVIALEYDAASERMLFEKVSGAGPQSGWISTSFKGKQLMVRAEGAAREDVKVLLDDDEGAQQEQQPPPVDSEDIAMQLYCSRFGTAEKDEGEISGLRRPVLPAEERPETSEQPEAAVCAELQQTLKAGKNGESEELLFCMQPPPGVATCWHCRLPLGDMAYTVEEDEERREMLMHSECMAQNMLKDMKRNEEQMRKEAAAEKKAKREEYDIGWKAEHIPRNAAAAKRFSGSVPNGLCCLVLDESAHTVSVAATVEPQAAVNLNYLSTALEVRRRDNREPLFSLDPVEGGDKKLAMQVKRFEPAWLAGTDVGEVLFQSDYHLKELSMGEYEQPVMGMKSCHDFSDPAGPDWAAREWFVVRKAEVQMSGDNVLMPFVKMGVEAREQIMGKNGMEDVKTTKPNHPLVRYAEAFTHNFDLIAERKSVVFHLRELAKASVMAKFLVESDVKLDDSWFEMGGETQEAVCLEIPQLWNDRYHSEIRVRDGKLLDADGELGTKSFSLYGGVQFGLDRFQLSGGRQTARAMSAGLAARQFVQPARHLASTMSAGLASRQFQRSFGPMGVQPTRVAAGVSLDKFSLSGARAPARMLSAGLAARQFVQPARHLSSTLSAGLATRQFQRSFGPMGVQPARVAAGVGLDKFSLSGARQPARMMSAGLAARQFVQPARQLSATLSAGLATRQFQRSFGPMGVQPARVAAGVGLDKFSLSGARQPARMMSAGLAARQFVQPARHLSATLSAGLATRQFQRSFGPMGVQPSRVSAGVSLDKFALSGARQPARMMSAGLAARQFVQPSRHLSATLSAGLATRQFQRSFGPMGVQPSRVAAGVSLDKFSLSGARQPARMLSAGLAARQFVQPARHLSATLSAGLATRQFQRSFGPISGVQATRLSAGVGSQRFELSGARQPNRMLSAGLAARQFVQPARHLSATLSAGLATRQFQRSFGPMSVQTSRVSAAVGLDRFALSGARQPSRMMSAGLAARQFVQPARGLSATLSAGLASRQFQRSFGPMGLQPSRVSADLARGVDLNLDEFNLSAPSQFERQDICVQLSAGADISKAFWADLGSEGPALLSEEDRSMLRKVFNPSLSDRRQEGDRFIPPDTSFATVQKLRALVKEEELVLKNRKNHFFSKSFASNEPGPLFPSTWKVTVEISREDAAKKQGRSLHARPDFKAQAHMFDQALKSAVPEFDKSAEDGTRFRVYRFGNLEVRTTQEHDGEETVGAVFSSQVLVEEPKARGTIKNVEKVVKATEYVEKSRRGCHVYVVLETEQQNVIVAEQLVTGKVKLQENPKDLEDRNALAKVVRTAKCQAEVIRVADIRQTGRKDIYCMATGEKEKFGFRAR